MSADELKGLQGKQIFGIDPGKNTLLHMADSSKREFQYTAADRRRYCRFDQHTRLIERHKQTPTVVHGVTVADLETTLSKENSKSLVYATFCGYASAKMDVYRQVIGVYCEEIVRKWRLRTYIATQRSEAGVLRRRKKFTGPPEEAVLVIGNWCPSAQMRNKPSTMTVGVRRLLSRAYQLFSIHEARTSKLCQECHEVTDQAPDPRDPDGEKTLWEKKVCNNRECSQSKLGRFSRDLNAAINIHFLADQFIKKGERPAAFMSNVLDKVARRKVPGVEVS